MGAILIVALVSSFVVVRGRGSDSDAAYGPATDLLPTMPDTIAPRFTADRLGRFESGYWTALPFDGAPMVQYDENGDERWSITLPSEWKFEQLHDEVDGLLPVEYRLNDDEDNIYLGFVDAETGEITDTEIHIAPDDNAQVYVTAGRLYVWHDHGVELYDPASGEVAATIDGTAPGFGRQDAVIFVLDGDRVSAYDLDLQPIVTDVYIEFASELDMEYASPWSTHQPWVLVDGTIMTFDDNRVIGNDSDGEAWTVDLEHGRLLSAYPFGDGTWFVCNDDGESAIVSGVGTEHVEELWRGDANAYAKRVGTDRLLVELESGMVLVAADGTELYQTEYLRPDEYRTVSNGFVFEHETYNGPAITFVDSDGNERWTIETETRLQDLYFGDNAILDAETRTVYGPE